MFRRESRRWLPSSVKREESQSGWTSPESRAGGGDWNYHFTCNSYNQLSRQTKYPVFHVKYNEHSAGCIVAYQDLERERERCESSDHLRPYIPVRCPEKRGICQSGQNQADVWYQRQAWCREKLPPKTILPCWEILLHPLQEGIKDNMGTQPAAKHSQQGRSQVWAVPSQDKEGREDL